MPVSPRLFALPLFVLMSAASLGCGVLDIFDAKTTLDDLDPKVARVEVLLGAQPLVNLELVGSKGCETITDDVEAFVDGQSMDLFMRGGQVPFKGGWVCGAPTFRKSLSADDLGGALTHFEASDKTRKVSVDIEGLLIERTVTPAAMNNTVNAGDEIELEWSNTQDEIDETTLAVAFAYEDSTLTLPVPATARVLQGKLLVKFSAESPKGKGNLDVDVKVHVPVAVCKGAPSCEATVHVQTTLSIDVDAATNPP